MAHQRQEQTIQVLRDELDTANKKVDRYVHLVASLSEELDNLRRSICHNCKNNFVPSYVPVASPLLHPTLSGHSTATPSSSPPPVSPSNTIRSITAETNPAILEALSSPFEIPTNETRPKQEQWRVSHNPNIKQSLQIGLVDTFNITAKVFCVKFSPDGKYLAIGTGLGSGKTFIYDAENGLKICCLVDLYLKNQPQVWCVQFSPDNMYIATASDKIRLWEIANERTRAQFTHSAPRSLDFSPDGRFVVAGERRRVRIWSVRDGSSKTLLDNASSIYSITFSPDGRHIASVDSSARLRIWHTRTGQLLDTWNCHTREGHCVAFSPDGKGLVSGGSDSILRYWDVSSLADMEMGRDRVIGGIPGQRFQQIRTFEGHTALVRTVSFSPDYRWVATSSHDDSVRIWDAHTAEWQCTLHGLHDARGRKVDFSPAGNYLASGQWRQVRIWRYSEV